MLKAVSTFKASTSQETDFYLWTQEQAQLLRDRRFDELDLANLIEEVESVGRSERREIRSRLKVLLAHLLKWKYQPDARKPGWMSTIVGQRQSISEVLIESPSLRDRPAEIFDEAYRAARVLARRKPGSHSRFFRRSLRSPWIKRSTWTSCRANRVCPRRSRASSYRSGGITRAIRTRSSSKKWSVSLSEKSINFSGTRSEVHSAGATRSRVPGTVTFTRAMMRS